MCNENIISFVQLICWGILKTAREMMCSCIKQYYAPFYRSAPEVILDGHYTHASDVWAFGILAWELYTSFTTEQNGRDLSVPFFNLEKHEVNSRAVFSAFLSHFYRRTSLQSLFTSKRTAATVTTRDDSLGTVTFKIGLRHCTRLKEKSLKRKGNCYYWLNR